MSKEASSQYRVRELHGLVEDYCTIAKNTTLEPERRYHMAMGEQCLGRIKTAFKTLGVSFSLDFWGPQILGYETCIDLAGSEIQARLESVDRIYKST